MTEEAARKRWCPFARVGVYTEKRGDLVAERISTHNRCHVQEIQPDGSATIRLAEMVPETARCIASECMAWRWEKISDAVTFAPVADTAMIEGLIEKGWQPKGEPYFSQAQGATCQDFEGARGENRRGRCGLAGKATP